MRRLLTATGLLALAAIGVTVARAGLFTAQPLTQVSGASPFASCTADDVAGQPGRNFLNSEVEPRVDVNPTDPTNIVGAWQQDRWSNGGARGLVAGVSFDGGSSWSRVVIPGITTCSGNPDFQRASDPWVSFAPNGDLYHVSLSIGIRPDGLIAPSALLVSKSTDGGSSWGTPITVIRDEPPTVLNDKQSITADPLDPNFVYLVWDRIVSPNARAVAAAFEHAIGFRGPTWFSRTTDGGHTWEPPRKIFDPGQEDQTIGNQIVVLPDGTLVDVFNLIFNFKNAKGVRGFNVALLRSADRGVTWSGPIIVNKLLSRALFDPQQTGVRDPDTGARIRTGDIIPDVAVDRGSGNLYAVWQDSRFSGFSRDEVAFALSADGGFTWSAPVKINQTPTDIRSGDRQAFTPTVKVAADGTIGVTYYDFRNNTPCPVVGGAADCAGVPLNTDYFIAHCHPTTPASCANPANWAGNETALTPASFDMRKAPVARGFFLGDYEGLAVAGNAFKPFFVQSGAEACTPANCDSNVFATTVGP